EERAGVRVEERAGVRVEERAGVRVDEPGGQRDGKRAGKHDGLRGWMIAGAVGLCIGYAMVLLAPGQAERYAGRAARYSALGLVTSRGVTGAYDIVVGFLGEVQWAV